MTFDPNAELSGQGVRRGGGGGGGRGRGVAIGGGSIGGLVVIVILALVFGVNPSDLLGGSGDGSGGTPSDQGTNLSQCRTGADANNSLDCRVQGARDSLGSYWTTEAPQLGISNYSSPEIQLFSGSFSTSCGAANANTGPFYCPPDKTIYLDTGFFSQLKTQFGATAGPLAQLYVVGHEWGHHIQNLRGTFNHIDQSQTGPKSDSVRLELQADCFAGAWIGSAATTKDAKGHTLLEPITESQLKDALNAASAVGDDHIQKLGDGQVDQDSWTHGSSAERDRWFTRGYSNGATKCDTFSASTL